MDDVGQCFNGKENKERMETSFDPLLTVLDEGGGVVSRIGLVKKRCLFCRKWGFE